MPDPILTPDEMDAMNESGKYKIIVCVPTHENVPYQFAFDLANMIGYTIAMLGDRVNIVTNVVAGTYIHRARQQLFLEALQIGCHYMMWLDSDMRFPRDTLIRLLQHNEDMVGINYSTRGVPPRYVAIKKVGIDQPDGKGKLCGTGPDSTGLEEVEALGFGAVLMKAKIAEVLPKDSPVFWFGDDYEKGSHVGEDVYFCRLVRKGGITIKVDHDLSKECAHCGHMEYRLEHVHAMIEEGISDGNYDVCGVADGGGELAEQERPDEPDS